MILFASYLYHRPDHLVLEGSIVDMNISSTTILRSYPISSTPCKYYPAIEAKMFIHSLYDLNEYRLIENGVFLPRF